MMFVYRNEMLPTEVPEIHRINLASTLLHLKVLDINNLFGFNALDHAPNNNLMLAFQQLHSLSAIDDEGVLTPLGLQVCFISFKNI